jgi:sugar-specific transcriptional regulator TrmB
VSLKLSLKALENLGLTEVDAQVYVYLAKIGPHEKKDLANALKLTKRELCLSLESLFTKGMINKTPEQQIIYSATPLEKIIDELTKMAKEQIEALQTSREELLSNWRSMIKKDSTNN